jgi:hypothetical protein
MNPMTYAFGIAAALLALIAIIELMRRATLRERHAVWWLVGGILALVVAIFPQTLTWAAQLLGIAVPTNLVFFIAIGLLFLVSLQYGAELTRVEDKIRTLAEQSAFHERRLSELEQAARSDDEADGDDGGPRDTGEAAHGGAV